MKKLLPIKDNLGTYQLTVESKEGKIVFIRYLYGLEHIQGAGTTEEKSQESLEKFIYFVTTYNAN